MTDTSAEDDGGRSRPKSVEEWLAALPVYVFIGFFAILAAAFLFPEWEYAEDVSAGAVLLGGIYVVVAHPREVAELLDIIAADIQSAVLQYWPAFVGAVLVVGGIAAAGYYVVHIHAPEGLDS